MALLLVYRFRFEFANLNVSDAMTSVGVLPIAESHTEGENRVVVELSSPGDYVIWGPGW